MSDDRAARRSLAQSLAVALAECVRDSSSGLRGSLANETDDPYSDIDLFWELPDAQFESALDELPQILESVAPVDSLRFDPLLQNSDKRRLAFVQFANVPLFWRVDIEISAESIRRDPSYDLDNRSARGDDWSLTESALMNAVAALKYLLRGDADRADESIRNAFARIGEPAPDAPVAEAVELLAELVGRLDLEQAELVRRVQLLNREVSQSGAGRASNG